MPVVVGARLRRNALRLRALQSLACRVLDAVGESDAFLSFEIVGDARMRGLNRRYRRKDKTTDVLAFAAREALGPASPALGDVVVSLPQTIRQARERGHHPDVELAVLLIHGVLHLCGYDHERSEAEARRMKRREARVLAMVAPIPRLLLSGYRVRV
ncbi:MAG: rRNA maturation RNase YbeY [Nitrospiraceae bacterium]|nr:rRNA maturation RNase YbeY [Nitrospiraceae bacterium]